MAPLPVVQWPAVSMYHLLLYFEGNPAVRRRAGPRHRRGVQPFRAPQSRHQAPPWHLKLRPPEPSGSRRSWMAPW